MSAYLRAHQGSARYELAAESATQIGSLIVQDARPVVILTTYEARVFTSVAKLKRLIAEGKVRYAFLNTYCDHEVSTVNAACSAPAKWVRAHGDRRLPAGRPEPRQGAVPAPGRDAMSAMAALDRRPCAAWRRDARAAGRIALDTEFMGEGRYRTLLCLIQLAVSDGSESPAHPENQAHPERIELVDPLAEDLDGSPLAAVLADPAVQVVVHAGRQDVALMRRRLDTEVSNVFDTQVAAGFAGMGAQISYDSLLTEILGCAWPRRASFTRWDARPLSPEQLAYAREDVAHLLELAGELERRLAALGRLEWAREECELARARQRRARSGQRLRAPAPHSRPERLLADDRARAGGVARAHGRRHGPAGAERPQRRRAGRARQAQAGIHPRARADPRRAARAARAGGRASCWRPCDVGASARPSPCRQSGARRRPSPRTRRSSALAEALVRARAREAGLAYELLAARADLQAIVAAGRVDGEEADVRTLRGWRRELVGAELLELLDGRVSLSALDRRLLVEPQSTAPRPRDRDCSEAI